MVPRFRTNTYCCNCLETMLDDESMIAHSYNIPSQATETTVSL